MSRALKWRLFLVCLSLSTLVTLGIFASCTMQEAKTVANEALTVSQIACVMASQLTNSEEVATACKIDATLMPLLRQLVAIREGANRAGVKWTSLDGGNR